MANGQQTGANDKTRRNHLPRVRSVQGTKKRHDTRILTMPKFTDKYADGTTKPGSRNPRKVGRG